MQHFIKSIKLGILLTRQHILFGCKNNHQNTIQADKTFQFINTIIPANLWEMNHVAWTRYIDWSQIWNYLFILGQNYEKTKGSGSWQYDGRGQDQFY